MLTRNFGTFSLVIFIIIIETNSLVCADIFINSKNINYFKYKYVYNN